MVQVVFQGESYTLLDEETVLECLERHDITRANSCRSGICQTCLMKVDDGHPPAISQRGLKRTWREQNYFLPCICKPDTDLNIVATDENLAPVINAEVIEKKYLNEKIIRIRFKSQQPINYFAGQFIHIINDLGEHLIRSYSLASLPEIDPMLEIHVQRVPEGKMSNWLHDGLTPGQTITLSGPYGDCYYLDGYEQQGILLLATGSGLAPIWGILKAALEHGHQGPIHLFHGGKLPEELYLVDELRALESENDNFSYTPCVVEGGVNSNGCYAQGWVQDEALKVYPNLKGWQVYLCGNPTMVAAAQRKAFIAGAKLANIHADPFIPVS